MSFVDVVRRARELLREEGRVSLRALKLEFDLDDERVNALVEELVDIQQVAAREGRALVWIRAGSEEPRPRARPESAAEEPEPEGPVGERRQLTVLFCDLVDSTRLAAGLDPEDWREIVQAYQAAAAAVVERFDGHVAQYLGDGLLVYFGWPKAHEDDAERAVRAGLGIVEAVRDLRDAGGTELSVRIGIHTGPVVVGQMGGGARRETLALGDTTNMAARLQAIAEPDTVVLSAATLRLVQGLFLVEDRGGHSVKGLAESVRIYRAVRSSGMRSRLDVAAAAGLTPLVGREQELRLLEDRWEQVCEGTGQAVVVSGEAGIGKSRLVDAFRQQLADTPHTWLECRCSAYTQDSAFLPVVDLLHQALAITADASPEEKLAQVESALGFAGFERAEALPLVAEFLSLPLPEGVTLPNLTAEARRRRTLALLAEWLLRLGRQQPVVLLAEDLHWVDPSTRELLGTVLEQVPTASVLALYTYRPDFESPWAGRSHVTPILLPRLTRRQVREMVRGASRGREVPEAWVREIMRRTDGVPLFVEELTRTLLESDVLDREGNVAEALERLSIPVTLQDSLMARLDQLGPVKEVAQLASCLGRELSFEVLLAVSPLGEGELGEALREAVEAEVFYQRGTPPEAHYLFKHALLQEAAYESLLRATRQRHHRRIAETLEKRFPEMVETRPELVAHHYAEGGEAERAVELFQRAGQRGIQRSVLDEAVRHLRRALGLLGGLPPGPARDGRELGLQTLLGLGLAATEGYGSAAVERAFDRAAVLCRALGESEALFPILLGQWLFRFVRADAEAQLATAERLLALAESSGKDDLAVEAHVAMGIALFFRAEYAESRWHLERSLALYDPERHRTHAYVYGQDPAAYAATLLSLLLWITGSPDAARREEERALAFAEGVAHPFTLAGILVLFLVGDAAERGEFERSLEYVERARSISLEQSFPMFLGFCDLYEGLALLGLDRDPEALQRLRGGIAALQSTGSLGGRTNHLRILAEALHRAGETGAGLAALDEAEVFVEKHHEHYWEPEIRRVRGEILRQDRGVPPESSEACFREALALARSQGARAFELRAATSLARLWRDQGKPSEARTLLQPVYAGFTEGFDTLDLVEAKALLEELGRG